MGRIGSARCGGSVFDRSGGVFDRSGGVFDRGGGAKRAAGSGRGTGREGRGGWVTASGRRCGSAAGSGSGGA